MQNPDAPETLADSSTVPITPGESVIAPIVSQTPSSASRPLARGGFLREAAAIVLMVVAIYTFVNLATARAIVEGASMEPNFYSYQLIIVNRFTYYFNLPQRGDVIVLHDPEDTSQDFIKRLVGLPGELIQIKEGRVYVNGSLLDEPYIPRFCNACDGTWQLDADHYFVLGDNRPNSHDSHAFGPLDRKLIVGQAWIRYWPPAAVGMIPRPAYGPIAASPPPLTPTAIPTPRPYRTPVPVTPSNRSRPFSGA